MKATTLSTVLLALLASCASSSQGTSNVTEMAPAPEVAKQEAPKEKKVDPAEQRRKIADLEHKVRVAQIKVDLAHLDVDGADLALDQKRDRAEKALAAAKASLAHFDGVEAPSRKGRAELSLQATMDSAKEAQEELEQIALMYDDQNLEDMTREFVIQRGKRRAERADKRIEFSKMDLRGLVHHKLKQEREKLEAGVLKAAQDLEAIEREATKNKLNRTLKLAEANHALKKAEGALKKASDEQAKGDQA